MVIQLQFSMVISRQNQQVIKFRLPFYSEQTRSRVHFITTGKFSLNFYVNINKQSGKQSQQSKNLEIGKLYDRDRFVKIHPDCVEVQRLTYRSCRTWRRSLLACSPIRPRSPGWACWLGGGWCPGSPGVFPSGACLYLYSKIQISITRWSQLRTFSLHDDRRI